MGGSRASKLEAVTAAGLGGGGILKVGTTFAAVGVGGDAGRDVLVRGGNSKGWADDAAKVEFELLPFAARLSMKDCGG